MNSLAKTIHVLEAINDRIGRVVSWLVVAMVLLTVLIVVLRYGFNLGWIAMQEAVIYLHACVFMLALAYTLKNEGHVRVDIFYRRLSVRGRAWVNLSGCLLLLLPVCLFMLWISAPYISSAWQTLEGSHETGGLPGVYLLKTLIPISASLLLLQGLAMLLRSIQTLLRRPDQ